MPANTNSWRLAPEAGYEPSQADWATRSGLTAWQRWVDWGELDPKSEPTLRLSIALADIQQKPAYEAALEAEWLAYEGAQVKAAAPGAEMDGEGGGMMLLRQGDPCETNEFQILSVEADQQGRVTVSWCGASNVVYQIQAASDVVLGDWQPQALSVGEGYSSWTDTNAPALEHRFYRCRALPGDDDADSDGLSNMAEFNLGTDLDNPDSDGDSIPDGEEVNVYGTDPLHADSDNDFWLDGAEVAAGYSPTNSASFPLFSFAINVGADVVTNALLQLGFDGLIADSVIISESITMAGSVTNQFASPLTYTLANTNDGLHTIFVQLLKSPSTLSPVFGRTFELDTHPPTLTITSPSNGVTVASRRINIEGFASDAATNAPALDATRPLLVTVNGDFVNDRETNGVWWSGLHDLAAGTNTFTAVATDRAGFSVTNSVWFIYDPTLATNVPTFSVDVTNAVVVVGSNTTSYALSGSIDDDNATVEIAVVDATDETITNATVNAAVHGTNWWAEVPVLPGSNAVVVIAKNSASLPARSGFTAVQDPNVFLEITSPAANTAVNASNVTVTGRASTNFNGTITVNGRPALVTPGSGEWIFNAAAPITRVDANVIEVHAEGSDGSSASVRQIVFGYEMLSGRLEWGWFWTHSQDDCFYARHYPHQHRWRDDVYEIDWWDETRLSYAYQSHEYSYSGVLLDSSQGSGSFDYSHDSVPFWFDSGWVTYSQNNQFQHVDASRSNFVYDCPYPQGHYCECENPPYCEGEDTSNCCIDTHEATFEYDFGRHAITFVKHWPTDEEQTVILHFDEFYYWLNSICGGGYECHGTDASKVRLWGQAGFEYSAEWPGWTVNVGFILKIRTNTRYTIRNTDFSVPGFSSNFYEHRPNAESNNYGHDAGQMFSYRSFGNEVVQLSSTKATKSPVTFEFGKTDIADPCTDKKAPALVVYYKDVIDQNHEVQPFDVKLQIIPGNNGTATWSKHSGPDSGTLNNAGSTTATFSNPTKGGLYRFDLDYLNKTTRTQALLPFAGADIADWLDTEIKAIPAWAAEHRAKTAAASGTQNFVLREYYVYRVWCLISGGLFDYTLHAVDASGKAPCAEFGRIAGASGRYEFVTINRTVAHGSKVNTMLWAVFGMEWGWTKQALQLGAHVNQIGQCIRAGGGVPLIDPKSSQEAIALGSELYSLIKGDPNASVKDALTQQQVLRLREDTDNLREEYLWPADEADLSKSILQRPDLPTIP